MKARSAVFETDEDVLLHQEISAVKDAFKDSPYRKVIVCTSETTDKSTMFMIDKEREGEDKIIKRMFLTKEDNNTNELEVDKLEEDGPPLHSFFITADEYGENMDSFIEVSKNRLTLYDQ